MQFSPLQFSKSFIFTHALTLGCCPRDRKFQFKEAISRTNNSLDVIDLVRQSRALTTLLRLLLSKEARYLIRQQRRQNVLEPALSSGDDDRKINFDGDGNSEHEKKLMRGVIYQDWNNELPKRSVIQNDTIHSVADP